MGRMSALQGVPIATSLRVAQFSPHHTQRPPAGLASSQKGFCFGNSAAVLPRWSMRWSPQQHLFLGQQQQCAVRQGCGLGKALVVRNSADVEPPAFACVLCARQPVTGVLRGSC